MKKRTYDAAFERQIAAELAGAENDEWEARITQTSRWCWYVLPVKGLTQLSTGYVVIGTRQRAERVARRKLARLRQRDQRDAQTITIKVAP